MRRKLNIGQKIYKALKNNPNGLTKKELEQMFNVQNIESYMYSSYLIYEEKDKANHTTRYFYAGDTQ